ERKTPVQERRLTRLSHTVTVADAGHNSAPTGRDPARSGIDTDNGVIYREDLSGTLGRVRRIPQSGPSGRARGPSEGGKWQQATHRRQAAPPTSRAARLSFATSTSTPSS